MVRVDFDIQCFCFQLVCVRDASKMRNRKRGVESIRQTDCGSFSMADS
jgi:hypothetical protein